MRDPDSIGLCLSGGGYKAAAFHLGALARLNELGLLRRLDRIASVSGGSILAAFLGMRWTSLDWSGETAPDFHDRIVRPFHRFLTTADIDVWAALEGLALPFRTGAQAVRAAYDRRLFRGATLQDLPGKGDGPEFILLATDYRSNTLWRFSRACAADYRAGRIARPAYPLAQVVAASSAFPPFFCPVSLDLGGGRRVELADGGVYDNLGLEPVWKRCGTVLVSNAGDVLAEPEHGPRRWGPMLLRVLGMIHRQAENDRVRWLMAAARTGRRRVAYWPLRDTLNAYRLPDGGAVAPTEADVRLAMAAPVRLWRLRPEVFRALYHHGYSLADAAVRSHLGRPNTPPARLPPV